MTPRVQGEPIAQGSDFCWTFGLRGGKRLISQRYLTTGCILNTVNKSIERVFLCHEFSIMTFKVVAKMLDTYGYMSTRSPES